MSVKKIILTVITIIPMLIIVFGCGIAPSYAKEKSYYEISENTSDDTYNIILLGGGGDNKVFKNGKDYGKVNEENIISAIEEDKINILAGHSTGANQVELFIRSGTLEDVIDMYVMLDAQAYVGTARYCSGDTDHPVLIFMSDQLSRNDSLVMKYQYSNNEIYYMRGTKHVDLATDFYGEVVDIIHDYYERPSLDPDKPLPETIDITVDNIWIDANNQDGKRTESVMVILYCNDTEKQVATKVVTPDEDGKLTCTFEDIPYYTNEIEIEYHMDQKNRPEYKNCKIYDYSIEVMRINEYDSEVIETKNGFAILNIHVPATVSRRGTVNWLDRNDAQHKRPESVSIYLMDGSTVVAEQLVTSENDWKWEFIDVPRYSEGREIEYSVIESEIDGYESILKGNTVTNTFKPQTAAK